MIKLIFNRFAGESAQQTIDIPIKVTTTETGTEKATKSVVNLRNALEQTNGKGISLNTSSIDKSIKSLTELQKMIDTLRNGKKDIKVDASISKLQSSGLFNALPSGVQGTLSQMSDLTGVVSKKGNYNEMTKEINALIDTLKKARDAGEETGNKIGESFDKADEEVKDTKKSVSDFLVELGKAPTLMQGLQKGFQSLDFVRLSYLYRSIRRVSSGIVSIVENAADYEESLNLFAMALGKYRRQAEVWSEEITTKLKLDPSEVMKYTGAFYNLIKGLGATSDASYLMSKNLTQLTYDMASYLNISNEAAHAKIQSAMAGQSRAVATVGVATQMASLQELALALGIKKSVSEMNQAEKTYLRYIQLMRSTTQMQGDLGRTMITPANAIRTLKNQIVLLGRAIGQILTPIIMKVIPYIMALTNVLTQAAQAVANFFGYKLADVDFSSAISFEDAATGADNLDKLGDSASKAAKKVSNSLAPFDELNVVMNENASAGGGGSGGSSGSIGSGTWDKLLPQYDMLKDYTSDLVDKAKDLEGVVKTVLGLIVGAAVATKIMDWTIKLGQFIESWRKLPAVVQNAASVMAIVAGLAVNVADSINFVKDVGATQALLDYTDTNTLGSTLAIALSDAFRRALSPVPDWILDYFEESGYKEKMEQLITIDAKKNIFGDLTVSANEWLELLRNGDETLVEYNTRHKELEDTLNSLKSKFDDASKNVELFQIKVGASGKLTKDDVNGIKESLKDMVESTSQMITTNTNYMLLQWNNTFDGMDNETKKTQEDVISHIMNYGTLQQKELKTAQDNITKTYDKALSERGYLTEKEKKYIADQLQKIRDLTRNHMSESETEIQYFVRSTGDGSQRLSEESYNNLKSSFKTYKEEQDKSLTTWYNERLNNLKLLYGDSEEEQIKYNNAVELLNIERQRREDENTKTLKGYQNEVLKNLLKTYVSMEGNTDETSRKTKEIIKNIFKDFDIDDKQLLQMMKDIGKDADDTFTQSWHDEATSQKTETTFWDGFKNGFGATFKGVTDATGFVGTIGSNVFKGIANGFSNALNNGKTGVGSLASKLYNGIKDKLGIKSPSRLFIRGKIGNYILMGITQGMYNEMDSLGDVTRTMLNTVQDNLDTGSLSFGDKISQSANEIVDVFKDMNNELIEFKKNADEAELDSNISINKYGKGVSGTGYATTDNNAVMLGNVIGNAISNASGDNLASNVVQPITINLGNETLWSGKVSHDRQQLDRYGSPGVINV